MDMQENAPRSLSVDEAPKADAETSFEKVEEMGKACQQLMDALTVDGPFSSADWLNELQTYITNHKRILYSVVSAWVFQIIRIDSERDKGTSQELLLSINKNLKTAYTSIEKKEKADEVANTENTVTTNAAESPDAKKKSGKADNIEDKDEVAKKIILKLYDHVNLVIQQANFIDNNSQCLVGKIATVSKQSFDEKIEHSEQIYEQRIRNSEKNYVAILGIFATIVLAFTGGLSFSTSVLSNIHHVPLYHSVFIALIIGIVLVNILYFMFYCIERCSGKEPHMWGGCTWIIVNVFFLFLLACDYRLWKEGVIEARDIRITQAYPSSAQEKTKASSVANSPHPHNTPPMVLQKETVSIFDATANKGPTHKDLD